MYSAGTKMYWKVSGLPAYEKLDNDDFGSWRSLQYDMGKPLKDRFGFKWTDGQVKEYYAGIMTFQLPKNKN